MTANELKNELQKRGISLRKAADELKIGYSTLRAYCDGVNPMPPQIESYITLWLNQLHVVSVVFSVSRPDGHTSYHVHAPERLADIERQQVMQAVRAKIDEELGS